MFMMRWLKAKTVSIGIIMAAVFLIADTAISDYVPYEAGVFIFAVSLLLVCSALIDEPRDGLVCGLTALVAQNTGTFFRYAAIAGTGIAILLLPYSLLLTSTYAVAGLAGGYVGRKLATSSPKRDRVGRKTSSCSNPPRSRQQRGVIYLHPRNRSY